VAGALPNSPAAAAAVVQCLQQRHGYRQKQYRLKQGHLRARALLSSLVLLLLLLLVQSAAQVEQDPASDQPADSSKRSRSKHAE
jgi:hypothetical protein